MALSFAGGFCGCGGLVRRERFVSWRGVQLSSGWTNSSPAAIFFEVGGEGSLPWSHGCLSCSRGPAPDPTTVGSVSFHLEPQISYSGFSSQVFTSVPLSPADTGYAGVLPIFIIST